MSFIKRIQTSPSVTAAPPRPGVRDQLGDEDKDDAPPAFQKKKTASPPEAKQDQQPIPDKEVPEEDEQEQSAPQQKQPKKEEKKQDPDEKLGEGDLPTGKKNTEIGRFSQIIAFHPYLFIVSGVGSPGNLMTFFGKAKDILTNPKYAERIAGPGIANGKNTDPLALTFAYLVSFDKTKVLMSLGNEMKLAVATIDVSDKLKKSKMPFQSIKLEQNIAGALGDGVAKLRAQMQASFEALEKTKSSDDEDDDDDQSHISAAQMQSVIPLDYLRFFGIPQSKKSFYIGGSPQSAGQKGMIYVLCNELEFKVFKDAIKKFHPLPNFLDDFHFLGDIDRDFKSRNPKQVIVDNCLILEAKEAFKIDQKMSDLEKKNKAQNNGGQQQQQNTKLAAKADLKIVPNLKEQTVFDALTGYAQEISKTQGIHAGEFIKGKYVQGSLLLHFSEDMKKCIMWCGQQPVNLEHELEEEIKSVFDLVQIDKTFSK